jgi:hypothetical protein
MLFALLATANADKLTLPADQSVWVYAHAGDPAHDEFLRIWGVDGMATPEGKGDGEDWGYGYLRWDVSKLPSRPLKSAILILHNINPPAFKPTVDKEACLQARGLVGVFEGKSWEFSQSLKIHPDLAATVFGAAAPKSWIDGKDPIEIDIDLMSGVGGFGKYLAAAEGRPDRTLCLALTSAINANTESAASETAAGLYKVYSAAAKGDLRPTLKLVY